MEVLNFNRVAERSITKGTLYFNGDLYLAGKVEGDLHISGGVLLIEPTGEVLGTIKGEDIQILGKVRGDIFAQGQVTIKSSGMISGTIHAKAMKVFPGAIIEAQLDIEYNT